MEKTAISTDKAPQAIGPYSQAVRVGDFLFLSGQISIDPSTGKMVEGDFKEQALRVMENVKGLLESQGLGMDSIVKTTIFLKDMKDYPKMNEIYGGYFHDNPPARSTVEVGGLPKGAAVEIEAIALATQPYSY
ncbi:MAG: reactive intermediate/imine deaminase [Proteobacteria bacterium]|nr:reactive intermediate/imine deaminase [Pseudomonadota bacterium]